MPWKKLVGTQKWLISQTSAGLYYFWLFFSSVMEYVGQKNCIMTIMVDTQLKYTYKNLQNCIPQKVKFCTLENKNKMWGNPQWNTNYKKKTALQMNITTLKEVMEGNKWYR